MQSNDTFFGKKLLLVTAHPDDESFLAAGTIMQNTKAGGTTILVCGTVGEKGKYHLASDVSAQKLKAMRRNELLLVSKYLGVAKLVCPGLRDGGMHRQTGLFAKTVAAAIKKYKPDLIITFGPDGITGHRDHIAAGNVARKAARQFRMPCLVFTLSPKVTRHAQSWMKQRRRNPHYIEEFAHAKPDLKIPIDSKVKLRALSFHKSQLDAKNPFAGYPAYAVKEFLSFEYFAYA